MKLTAKLKTIEELKSLPTFEYEYEFEGVGGNLKFTNDSITAQMLNKSNVELKWDNKNKRFVSLDNDNYYPEWLTEITDKVINMSYSIGDILYSLHDGTKVQITNYSNYIYFTDNGYGYLDYELDEHFINLKKYQKLLDLMGEEELLKLVLERGVDLK